MAGYMGEVRNSVGGSVLRTRLLKDRQGLTLIELLVAMGILGIVLTVCFSFLFFGYRSFGTGFHSLTSSRRSGLPWRR